MATRSIYSRSRALVERLMSPPGVDARHGLPYWQERMLAAILLTGVAIGVIVYPPSIWLAIREDLPEIVLADTLILGFAIAVLVLRRVPFWIRASTVVAVCYLLGLELLVVLGPYGAGPVWLFTAPVFAGVLGGQRAAAAALLVNATTVVVFCVLIAMGSVSVSQSVSHPVAKWVVIGLNFMLLNTLAAVCVSLPLRGLQSSLKKEQASRVSLERSHDELVETHSKLVTTDAERRQAERNLTAHLERLEGIVAARTATLAATNKELEAFAYSVSHDLRAPLRAIDGFSQVLVRDYSDKLDDDGKGHLNRVSAAARRMGRLIDELLELSRLARADLRYANVDLKALAGEIADELQMTEPDRKVSFVIDAVVTVNGDATLLRAALTNLLANAWKFTSHHDRATIEFGTTTIDGGAVHYVRDDGAGFDMDHSSKLFGAFQRLHDVTEFPGTGVGLATVQRAIHRHGGRVWAKGEVEKGATFYFTLPERTT